jgi:hypothetical protein
VGHDGGATRHSRRCIRKGVNKVLIEEVLAKSAKAIYGCRSGSGHLRIRQCESEVKPSNQSPGTGLYTCRVDVEIELFGASKCRSTF